MARFQSNNPVFARSAPLAAASGRRPAGFRTPTPGEVAEIYATPQRLTVDDIVVKTGLLLALLVSTGAVAWYANVGIVVAGVALVLGAVLAMVNIFKARVSPPLVLAYAACEGVLIGAVSHAYNGAYHGIVAQAVVGTLAVFGGVLLAYRSGRLRATPKFTKMVIGGLIGLVGVAFVDALASVFVGGDPLGVRGGNLGLSVLFSLGMIGFGAMTFVIDFDQAEKMVDAGVDTRESWRISFGLVVGLVFIYLEILRLLSYLQGRD